MSVEAGFLKHASPPASPPNLPQVLRVSMTGTNALTGALCAKSVVRLHNRPPGPQGGAVPETGCHST